MDTESTPDPSHLLLDNQLCFALYAASKAMIQAYRPYLEPIGITYPQYLVFMVLWEEEGITLKHLGERLSLDSGTLTPLIKRLEKEGFVTRERSTKDERAIQIRLTSKGHKLKSKAIHIPSKMLCHLNTDIPMLEQLRSDLKSLLKLLQTSSS